MNKLNILVAAVAVAVGGSAFAAPKADSNGAWDAAKAAQVAANKCTNAGRGNGGEVSVSAFGGSLCIDDLPVDDQDVNISAKDPLVLGPFSIATDPGNSAQ